MPQVLIVDERDTLRALLKALLSGQQLAFEEAASAAEGIARARANRPDLVIVGLSTAEAQGTEFLLQLQAEGDQPPIVVVSDQLEVIQGLLPAERLVATRPIEPTALRRLVKRGLELSRTRRAEASNSEHLAQSTAATAT